MKINEEEIKNFFHFINERQEIWYKRFINKEDPPWTNDKILQKWKFCNVYRENDSGTIFLQENILNTKSDIELLFKIIVYRIFNKIETYEEIKDLLSIQNYECGRLKDRLKAYRENGNKVFTNAFMITGLRFAGSLDKIDNICYVIDIIFWDIKSIYNVLKNEDKTLETFHNKLMTYKGFGGFLAYIICTDIIQSRLGLWSEDDWVHWGNGCVKGLRILFPNITRKNYEKGLKYLKNNQEKYFKELNLDFKYINEKKLSLMNIEHCVCEYYKWWKTREKIGRPRIRFQYKKM